MQTGARKIIRLVPLLSNVFFRDVACYEACIISSSVKYYLAGENGFDIITDVEEVEIPLI